ncbi:putative hydrolase of the HAD superfamily [Alkalispirochaeta americana]|uniref:Putative hydrolase of the HAD superfamily n=1 Tax=Alkalispirochaeta americana TaxID=159291 RepID=A0A1N6VYK4_9SPIO|nr:HAD family hydrolase [Alkalispirochaeta americana]SIQ82862.1 putative hydrolase of the HAD superfamily [Alkalispirochaeta americana]
MQYFPGKKTPKALLFDIDNTLYRHAPYVAHQTDVLVARLARQRGQDEAGTRQLVEKTRREIASATGRTPSLATTFVELGVPIAESILWRRELLRPGDFLGPDPVLAGALRELGQRLPLGVVTNNPEETGWRTLKALGLEDLFPVLAGLDTRECSKPSWPIFQAALDQLGCSPAEVLLVGDRYDVDLEPVIRRGGSGLLLEKDADLTLFPRFLLDQTRPRGKKITLLGDTP